MWYLGVKTSDLTVLSSSISGILVLLWSLIWQSMSKVLLIYIKGNIANVQLNLEVRT